LLCVGPLISNFSPQTDGFKPRPPPVWLLASLGHLFPRVLRVAHVSTAPLSLRTQISFIYNQLYTSLAIKTVVKEQLLVCVYIYIFFFFYCRYNPLSVLAFSVISFHSALSLHNFLPFRPFLTQFPSIPPFLTQFSPPSCSHYLYIF
jgi:hypothetical protein